MPPTSYQTIKLSRGRASSPEHGACVMELASMLAGECFTDHPRSVSRPIASFLRGYNDLVDDRRRADLYRYAAQAVGTAGSSAVEDARVARLLAWGDEIWMRRASRSVLERLRFRRAVQARSSEPAAAGAHPPPPRRNAVCGRRTRVQAGAGARARGHPPGAGCLPLPRGRARR